MEKLWHVFSDNQQKGPFSWEDLKTLVIESNLKKEDLVWKEGMEDWEPASNIKDLFPIEASPPPIPQHYQAKPPIPPALRKESLPAANHSQPVSPDSTDARQEQAPKGKSPLKILALVGGGIVVLTALVMAVILLVAPIFVTAEMEIHDIATSAEVTDDDFPLNPTGRFSHLTETVYVTMRIDNIPEGMVFYGQWFHDDELMVKGETFTSEYTDAQYAAYYYVEGGLFLPGNYQFKLRALEDDRVLAEADFEVFWEHIPIEQLHHTSKIFRTDGFAFAYPQDWSHMVEDGIDFFYKNGLKDEVLIFPLVYDAVYPADDHKSMLASLDAHKEGIESFDGTYSEHLEEVVFIDGIYYPYFEITENSIINNKSITGNTVIIKPEGNYVYSFTFLAVDEHYDTYLPVAADIIIGSLSFK